MQGGAAARRSFAAQSTAPGSKIRAAQLLHDSVEQDRKSLYMAHSALFHALGLLPWL